MADKKSKARKGGYVTFGSDEHAALLGLRKAAKEDLLQLDGWTLEDVTSFGPQVTEMYLREVLRQKVSELNAGPPPQPQSEDWSEPNFYPKMWEPSVTLPE